MRSYDGPTTTALAEAGVHAEILIWVTARNRSTGVDQTVGLWTGDDHASIDTGSGARLFYGAGTVLDVGAIQSREGLDVISQTVSLNMATPEVEQLIRGYDARLAAVEMHRALFNADGQLVSTPHRIFKGHIDEEPVTLAGEDGEYKCELTIVSIARMLSVMPYQMQSDEAQKRRSGDRFLRYASISGEVKVLWGASRAGSQADGNSPADTRKIMKRFGTGKKIGS